MGGQSSSTQTQQSQTAPWEAAQPMLQGILGGVSAAAAGLVIGTGLRLLVPYRDHPMALSFAALAFGGLVFTKLPLLIIIIALAPLSVAIAAISSARGQ